MALRDTTYADETGRGRRRRRRPGGPSKRPHRTSSLTPHRQRWARTGVRHPRRAHRATTGRSGAGPKAYPRVECTPPLQPAGISRSRVDGRHQHASAAYPRRPHLLNVAGKPVDLRRGDVPTGLRRERCHAESCDKAQVRLSLTDCGTHKRQVPPACIRPLEACFRKPTARSSLRPEGRASDDVYATLNVLNIDESPNKFPNQNHLPKPNPTNPQHL